MNGHSIASATTESCSSWDSSDDSSFMEDYCQNYFHIEPVPINYSWFFNFKSDVLRFMNRIRIEDGFLETLSPAEMNHYKSVLLLIYNLTTCCHEPSFATNDF